MISKSITIAILSALSVLLSQSCRVDEIISDGDRDSTEDLIPQDISADSDRGIGKTILSLGDTGIGFGGMDILLVIDDSPGMLEEQKRFATAVYSLIASLTKPLESDFPVTDVRVAVVSTRPSAADSDPIDGISLNTCDTAGTGRFGEVETLEISLANDLVACDDTARQCPRGWECIDRVCKAKDSKNTSILCDFTTNHSWIETTSKEPDPLFAEKAACLSIRQKASCEKSSQLETALSVLHQNPGFLKDDHLLIVMVLSNNDNCAVSAPDSDTDTDATVCGEPSQFYDGLTGLKDNRLSAVLFAAAVGAPLDNPSCVGANISTLGCDLEFLDGSVCTDAWYPFASVRSGRRFIETASLFKERGYIQSICEPTFDNMVGYLKNTVNGALQKGQCLLKDPLETEAAFDMCENCVQSQCEMYVEIVRTSEALQDQTCPKELMFGDDYIDKAWMKKTNNSDGTLKAIRLFCPVEKMPSPLNCEIARQQMDQDRPGWAYCENSSTAENTEALCVDGVDDDFDGVTDCSDFDCMDCLMCGNPASTCDMGCRHELLMTSKAVQLTAEYNHILQCPY